MMSSDLNSPFKREVFAEDFLEGRTVKGSFESIESLVKANAYYTRSKKKKFDKHAFIIPTQPDDEFSR